jgi:hypothetical protein
MVIVTRMIAGMAIHMAAMSMIAAVATMSAMAKVSVVSTLAGTAYWEFGLGQELGYTRSERCKYQCCLDSGCMSDVVDTKAYNDGRELCVM